MRSEAILEGEAGLFAAFGRRPRPISIALFADGQRGNHGGLQQAGAGLQFRANRLRRPRYGLRPNSEDRDEHRGHFDPRRPRPPSAIPAAIPRDRYRNALQAKMSIPFSVAATLVRGAIEEDNYAEIDDPEILRLVG